MKIRNKLGLLGVAPCLVFGLMTLTMHAGSPAYLSDTSFPVAWLARSVAAAFETPAGPYFAGSAYFVLAGRLYLVGELVCMGLFAWAYWLYNDPERQPGVGRSVGLLLAQVMVAVVGSLDLLYFFVLEVAIVLPVRPALRWLAVAMGCAALVHLPFLGIAGSPAYMDPVRAAYRGLTMLTLLVIAFGVGRLVASERRGRLRVAAAHAELLATQQLLADAVRTSERLRIARDVHDAIGHHLTALNLQLELALRQQAGAGGALVAARGLAQSLLSEVRTVVGMARQGQAIDVQQALRTLCAGIPRPPIALDLVDTVSVRSPAVAQALFYAVQEAVTNAVRHAQAAGVRVVMRGGDGRISVVVSDDGLGRRGAVEGNGLRGMRERIDAVGGTVEIDNDAGPGTAVRLTVPSGEPA